VIFVRAQDISNVMAEKEAVVSEAPPEKPGVVTASDDKALQFLAEHQAVGSISAKDSKRVLRKVDCRLVPMVSSIAPEGSSWSNVSLDGIYRYAELAGQKCTVVIV
jgi:hypothetical protein